MSEVPSESTFYSGFYDGNATYFLRGNNQNNVIDRSAAGDRRIELDGGAGADTLIGGYSRQTIFVVDNAGDVIRQSNTYDKVRSSISWALGGGALTLELTGSAAIAGTGDSANNVIDGSLNSAANILAGLAGDDTYIIDALDYIAELAGGGVDTAVATWTAAEHRIDRYQNIEGLRVSEAAGLTSLVGDGGANELQGNSFANQIDGGAGADVIVDWLYTGKSSARWQQENNGDNDTLLGGAGDDLIHRAGATT